MPHFAFTTLSRPALGRTAWNPATLGADLALWLDAAGAATQAGPVQAWPDRAGRGAGAVQADPARQPVWRHDDARGRGVLRFDHDMMTLPNLGLAGAVSAFWVMAPDTRAATSSYPIYMFLDGSSFDGQGRKPLLHGVATTPQTLTSQIGNIGVTHSSPPGRIQIGSIISYPGRIESTLNGGAPLSQSHQVTLSASTAPGQIGAASGLCDWCELVVLSRSVTAQERVHIEGYLAHRWACADLLPATHAHATAAP